MERGVLMQKSRAQRHDVVDGISLGLDQADPERLRGVVRQPWQIANQVQWVRAVTFDENRSHVCCGSMPQVMAACRNTALGLIRQAGETNMAAACQRFAARRGRLEP
jgi:predicted transposase YbfD/YdcC